MERKFYLGLAVEEVVNALSDHGEVLHIGAMPHRFPRTIRLVIRNVEEEMTPSLLENLGWTGPVSGVVEILSAIQGRAPRFRLCFDVNDYGVSPRLGIEIYVDPEIRPGRPSAWLGTRRSDWAPFITWMEEVGWCLPVKAPGLLEWSGIETVYADGKPCRLYRGLNHIKISIDGNRPIEAKAYAGMSFVPLP